MGIGGSLRELARFLEECEETGGVESVAFAGGVDAGGGGSLTADVEVSLSTCRSDGDGCEVALETASVGADGRLNLAFESTDAVLPTSGHEVEIDVTGATVATDGTVRVTLAASLPAGDARDAEVGDCDEVVPETAQEGDRSRDRDPPLAAGTEESTATGQDPDVPPFRNPDLLAEVYESCETFAEMTDALGMDVTAETVRRYMIDYGIHEPRSYDTARTEDAAGTSTDGDDPRTADAERDDPRTIEGDESDDRRTDGTDGHQPADGDDDLRSPVVLADGIGLPDEVTVDAIVESVRTSDTIYEVKRDVGLDRDETVELLRELDLLDLVVGRLTTEAEREISRQTVVDHLRARADGQ